MTAVLFVVGLGLMYIFARSKLSLSQNEGLVLLGCYALFVGVQLYNVLRFAGN